MYQIIIDERPHSNWNNYSDAVKQYQVCINDGMIKRFMGFCGIRFDGNLQTENGFYYN